MTLVKKMKINLNDRQRVIIEHARFVINYVFQTLLILFLLTLIIQQFYPDFIASRININWFMAIVIIFGAISILFPPESAIEAKKPASIKDLIFIVILGIIGGIIIFLKLKNTGWISYIISILGGLVIILLSWLVLTEDEKE